jgi:Asp-tRNA(Asn)/Glu-tRNA(Gln) amidotransferase A subunit family amidase
VKSLAELAADLRARRLSSVEATALALDRIDAAQAKLNAFITVDRDGALAEAKAAASLLVGHVEAQTYADELVKRVLSRR